jgi:putative membrane protein
MRPGFGWGGCCGYGGFGGFGLIGGIIGLVLTVVFFIALILLVVWAVRRITSNQRGSTFASGQNSTSQTAREILQARYAHGEITREEYRQMLEDIG